MKFYLYDKDTKEYQCEQLGYIDPLETELRGEDVYLIPPYSTDIKPNLSELKDNEIFVFNGSKWEIQKEFYVGKIVDCQSERVSKYVTDNDLTFEPCDEGFKIVEKPKKTESMILIEKYQSEIVELKKYLSDTDYKAIKFAEGELSEEAYREDKLQRHDARARINELESLIEELSSK